MKPAPDTPLTQLLQEWQRELALLDDLASPLAAAYRRHVRELEAALEAFGHQELTLDQASKLGGYDKGSLTRLIREGKVKNVGRRHAPRIRRQDVPIKPGTQAELTPRDLMRIVPHRKPA